jgi:hypothetical protein
VKAAAIVLLTVATAAGGCTSAATGGATGGQGGSPTGGAGGGATGGAGGTARGGSGGSATGGSGGMATGGSGGRSTGGSAGGGAAGSGLFTCSGVSEFASCSVVGLTCQLPSEALQWCYCAPAQGGGGQWACYATAGPCPAGTGSSGTCDPAAVAAVGGCKYPPAIVCSCPVSGDAGTFSCRDVACPAAPPTGLCSVRVTPAVVCSYQAGAITCDCETDDAGARRWRCNGHATPDCPASSPGSSADCSAYQPGTVCSYQTGSFTDGLCTCTANGGSRTWQCPSG